MNTEIDKDAALDTKLSQMFGQMRQQDAQHAPAYPSRDDLLALAPASPVKQLLGTRWKMAVAASVVALTAVLMNNPVPEDPAALYADIMSANAMTTDSLLSVSHSTLPEMGSLPDIFELGTSLPGVPNGR